MGHWEVLGASQSLCMTAWERCGACIFPVNLSYICYKDKRKKKKEEKNHAFLVSLFLITEDVSII